MVVWSQATPSRSSAVAEPCAAAGPAGPSVRGNSPSSTAVSRRSALCIVVPLSLLPTALWQPPGSHVRPGGPPRMQHAPRPIAARYGDCTRERGRPLGLPLVRAETSHRVVDVREIDHAVEVGWIGDVAVVGEPGQGGAQALDVHVAVGV